jgi:hypothetical protein
MLVADLCNMVSTIPLSAFSVLRSLAVTGSNDVTRCTYFVRGSVALHEQHAVLKTR